MHPLAKLIMGVLNKRLTLLADEKQLRAHTQAGFRAHYSLEDLVLTLQLLIQQANASSSCLAIAFVDFEKAYDSIDRAKLWQTLMEECGVPESYINTIKNMY